MHFSSSCHNEKHETVLSALKGSSVDCQPQSKFPAWERALQRTRTDGEMGPPTHFDQTISPWKSQQHWTCSSLHHRSIILKIQPHVVHWWGPGIFHQCFELHAAAGWAPLRKPLAWAPRCPKCDSEHKETFYGILYPQCPKSILNLNSQRWISEFFDEEPVGHAVNHQDWVPIIQTQTLQQLQNDVLGGCDAALLHLTGINKCKELTNCVEKRC